MLIKSALLNPASTHWPLMPALFPPDHPEVCALTLGLCQLWCSKQVGFPTKEVFTKFFTVAPERCVKLPELAGTNTILKTLASFLMWAMISNALLSD